jgi:CheY-like chemotaxis protein
LEIVLVENSDDDVALLRRAFQVVSTECSLKVFAGAADAWRYLDALEPGHDQNPDLVVLDLHLPDSTGDLLLKRLRAALPHLKDIPVAVVSNHEKLMKQLEPGSFQAMFEKTASLRAMENLGDKPAQPRCCHQGIFPAVNFPAAQDGVVRLPPRKPAGSEPSSEYCRVAAPFPKKTFI